MTEERRSRVYARRRDLRVAPLLPPPPETLAAWAHAAPDRPPPSDDPPPLDRPGPFGGPPSLDRSPRFDGSPPLAGAPAFDPDAGSRGPTLQDLELYQPDPALPARRPAGGATALPPQTAGENVVADRGERARAHLERWSLWAAGLGKPPRDGSGRRRYPGREGLLPPALLLAAGLGVAGLIGLLAGLLLNSPGGGAAAATAVPTITVTRSITPPAVTETRTRTRTRTTTDTVTATEQAQNPDPGTVLQVGSQGPAVTQLQQDLATLGLYQGQPSGSYDGETRAAVRAFQGGFGVAGDPPGVAGPATLAALARAAGRG